MNGVGEGDLSPSHLFCYHSPSHLFCHHWTRSLSQCSFSHAAAGRCASTCPPLHSSLPLHPAGRHLLTEMLVEQFIPNDTAMLPNRDRIQVHAQARIWVCSGRREGRLLDHSCLSSGPGQSTASNQPFALCGPFQTHAGIPLGGRS